MDGSLTLYTIAADGEGFYKEKGSKFYAHAYPVIDEDAVKTCLESLRKQYHDARHHCYAFRLGLTNQHVRANDDGEPNHSAGDPILGQIRSHQLTNVLVVVVRYFGGTKLGVGGLIHAYKTAAEEALKGLPLQEVFDKAFFSLKYSYEQTPTVERFLQQFELYDVDRTFAEDCQVTASVRSEQKERMNAQSVDSQLVLNWRD